MLRLIFVVIFIIFNCQVSNAQIIVQPYKYPVTKGSAEWDSIKDYRKLRSVCQIPLNVVNQMTTEALFESVLDYPLIGDAFVFSTFQTGVENLKINFRAFEVLNNRIDLGKVLIDQYVKFAVDEINTESLIIKGEHSVKLSFIELMLGQEFTNSTLTKEEVITLAF